MTDDKKASATAAGKRLSGTGGDADPDSPTDVSGPGWFAILRRSLKGFKTDNLTDWAAALTYYGVLALFPGILVVVSVLGLLGPKAIATIQENVGQVAPGGVKTFFNQIISNAQGQHTTASFTAIIGLVLALWSASGYIAAFMRAINAIYGVGEGRPVWKTIPVRVGVTLSVVVMLLISAVIVLVSGNVADQVGKVLGVGDTGLTVWNVAKWPVLLIIVALTLAILYWACPNVKQPGFRWLSPGAALAVVIWLVASGAFAVYVANFASYNKTYGSVAGVIVFLVWLWITNLAVLLGAEFNAELDRQKAIAQGVPESLEPFAVPRDTRKLDEDDTQRAEALSRKRSQSS
ncbi:YihY/virulence factor BrkB family protein [Jatrophihabitans lederbergiae]|uniref:YihY/virulence factor BrkB family protein n=1 Tax=Jatrophihabitans lederbergiae TaxID=3075547 RepID=A0ABU2JCN4_9ACTN|nr:YihY/virulence factor BrkB family protein [Jatrophihabitans sp. DSM 44399]MDT0262521.1 YihY/virulence factor BrkB family protein [Jatrophihabitans sp. DSM 44399]